MHINSEISNEIHTKKWECESWDEYEMVRYTHTRMAAPSERPESLLQDILWLGGSFPDLWPSKKRMDLVRASL